MSNVSEREFEQILHGTESDLDLKNLFYCGVSISKLESIITRFEKNNILPSTPDRISVMQYIQHKNIEYVVKGDYPNAEKFEKLAIKFKDECILDEKNMAISSQMGSIDQQLNSVQQQLDTIKETHTQRIESMKSRDMSEIRHLSEKHQKELQIFDQTCSEPEFIRQFNKISARLMKLRSTQKNLMLAKMFDDAAMVKKEADDLEKAEIEEAHRALSEHISKKKKAIEMKQQNEILRARNYTIRILEDMNNKYIKETKQLQARLSKLQKDKDLLQSGVLLSSLISQYKEDFMVSKASPRSKLKLDSFRKSMAPRRLVIRPITQPTFPKIE